MFQAADGLLLGEEVIEQLPLQYRPVVQIAINTGLLQGELLQLTWSDIDWNAGIVTVQETKAGDKRRMPMNSTVLAVLTSLRARCATQPTDQVFPHGARYLRRAFERAVKAAGLTPFRFHDLRHTFTSRLAMQGANDRTLMALGGWKSPAMLSRYAHLSPPHLFHAVEGLTRIGTAPKTVTKESADEEHTSKLLEEVVSRLGVEPRTLALKDRKVFLARLLLRGGVSAGGRAAGQGEQEHGEDYRRHNGHRTSLILNVLGVAK